MHSSVFGMHVHLGLFAQLSQSGRSESKNAKVTKKNPGMGIPIERPSFLISALGSGCVWRQETGLTYFLF